MCQEKDGAVKIVREERVVPYGQVQGIKAAWQSVVDGLRAKVTSLGDQLKAALEDARELRRENARLEQENSRLQAAQVRVPTPKWDDREPKHEDHRGQRGAVAGDRSQQGKFRDLIAAARQDTGGPKPEIEPERQVRASLLERKAPREPIKYGLSWQERLGLAFSALVQALKENKQKIATEATDEQGNFNPFVEAKYAIASRDITSPDEAMAAAREVLGGEKIAQYLTSTKRQPVKKSAVVKAIAKGGANPKGSPTATGAPEGKKETSTPQVDVDFADVALEVDPQILKDHFKNDPVALETALKAKFASVAAIANGAMAKGVREKLVKNELGLKIGVAKQIVRAAERAYQAAAVKAKIKTEPPTIEGADADAVKAAAKKALEEAEQKKT